VIVRTFDGLQALTTPQARWMSASSNSLNLYGLNQAYADIYRTQPNVRICVDFKARNVAQLALQVFRRVSDTDRERLVDHDLARWLGKPNPGTTTYRLIEDLMTDFGIYFRAYWLKVRYRGVDGRDAIGLVRLPPEEMTEEGPLYPTAFIWTVNGRERRFAPSEIVHFAGYQRGISPLETLRRILAEESAAGEHREGFWRNAARIDGVVTRPKEVKRYTKEQALDWREQWQAAYAGGQGSGKTVLLQDGEIFTPQSFSAKDSEYTVGGKLRREICAAEYHIPQPMVGILEHATFSNIKEQHKHLYADCLGPDLVMIVQEVKRQLLVECDDQKDIYSEFNIDAKLAGSFEEQAQSLQIAVGKPWMKVNEARAIRNLPRDENPESDEIAPQQGGPSDATARPGNRPDPNRFTPEPDDEDDDAEASLVAPVLHAARLRQQARLAKLPITERAATFYEQLDRWNRELAADLTPIVGADHAVALATRANVATLTTLLALEAA